MPLIAKCFGNEKCLALGQQKRKKNMTRKQKAVDEANTAGGYKREE